jgi:hypothetical protein
MLVVDNSLQTLSVQLLEAKSSHSATSGSLKLRILSIPLHRFANRVTLCLLVHGTMGMERTLVDDGVAGVANPVKKEADFCTLDGRHGVTTKNQQIGSSLSWVLLVV